MIRALACAVFLAAPAAAQEAEPWPAGTYTAEPAHTTLLFSVDHLGLSAFTATFDTVEATLVIDPDAPEAAQVTARIPVASLDLPAEVPGFRETLMSASFFDAEAHPDILFASHAVERVGDAEARIHGTLTLRGVAHPATLSARFNGGYGPNGWEPFSRIGFSATATMSRSAHGMTYGVPSEGSTFGVGDRVTVVIETEFVQPTD